MNKLVHAMTTKEGAGEEVYTATTQVIDKVGYGLGKPLHISCADVLDRIKIIRDPKLLKIDTFLESDSRNEEILVFYMEHLIKKSLLEIK